MLFTYTKVFHHKLNPNFSTGDVVLKAKDITINHHTLECPGLFM